MKSTRLTPLLLWIVLTATLGCSNEENGPKQIMTQIHQAYQSGTVSDYLQLFHTNNAKEVQLLRQGYLMAKDWQRTGKVVDEVYGKGTWENFFISKKGKTDKKKGTKAVYQTIEIPGLSPEWAGGYIIKFKGENKAIVSKQSHKLAMPMVKIKGQWWADGRLDPKKSKDKNYAHTLIVYTQEFRKQLAWLRTQARKPGMTWQQFVNKMDWVAERTKQAILARSEKKR